MIIANFRNDSSCTVAYSGLWQYDYGQKLRIQGLDLPTAVEIHFSLQETGGESVTRVGVTKDGVTDVPIPDSMIENNGANRDYKIYVFIYLTDETSGETIRKIVMPVRSRPKPEAFDTPEDAELFREAIAAVNEAADRAGEAERSSEAWAHGHADYPGREEDNAAYYAKLAQDASKEIPGHVNCAKKEIDRYVQEKEQELKGETGNVYFAAFKVVNGRLIMYSDPEIDKVHFVRVGSRLMYRLAF